MALPRMMRFAADEKSAAAARAYTTKILTRRRLPELVDDGELIISELVTNAINAVLQYIQHLEEKGQPVPVSPEIWVYLAVLPRMVVLGVENMTDEKPEPREASDQDENGRGFTIVEALAKFFDWTELTDGSVTSLLVYAVLARPVLPRRKNPLPEPNWKLSATDAVTALLGLRALPRKTAVPVAA